MESSPTAIKHEEEKAKRKRENNMDSNTYDSQTQNDVGKEKKEYKNSNPQLEVEKWWLGSWNWNTHS